MTRQLFSEWLQAWDSELGRSYHRVCLLLDNCSAHHTTCKLQNIEVRFLPPNTTSRLQPLDQGIIKAFKVGYRRRLLQRLLINLRMGMDLKIDLLGAIQMMAGAWNDVKRETVANCFRKAGFVAVADEACADALDDDDFEYALDDELRKVAEFPEAVPTDLTAHDFVSADDNVHVVAEMTDADIIVDVAGDDGDSSGDEGSLGGVNSDDVMPTATEIASAFATIRRCCGAIEGAGLSHLGGLEKIENSVMDFMTRNKRQAQLTEFFRPK
ncbi:tigger transposable element-derived protein 6-like [Ornithodoros turicata]|uniref:tigger transposable element-derived protein 6-like n=1 Tax=Ornithodoros turicata TaxID=34597 RepID=UPI00313A2FD0